MWKTTVRAQGTSGVSPTSAAMKASCELPVANMACTTPRAATAARITSAAWSAAARAMCARSGCTTTVAPSTVHVRVSFISVSMPAAARPDWIRARRGDPRSRPPRRSVEGGPAVPAADAGRGGAPARLLRGGQGRDGAAHGLVQGAGRAGRRLGHARGRARSGRGRLVGRQSRAGPGVRRLQARSAGDRGGAHGGLGRQGVGPASVRRPPRPPWRGLQRGRGPRAGPGRGRGQPLRVSLQRPRRHRRPVHRWPASCWTRCPDWAPWWSRAEAAACWPA